MCSCAVCTLYTAFLKNTSERIRKGTKMYSTQSYCEKNKDNKRVSFADCWMDPNKEELFKHCVPKSSLPTFWLFVNL